MPGMTAQLRMDMRSPEYSQARGPVGYACLSRKEVSLFRRLIEDRRSLPVYRAGSWLCYECAFASTDLAAMVRHIVRAHGAVPTNEDDVDEDDHDKRFPRRVGGFLSAHKIFRRGRVTMNGRANPSYMLVTKSCSVSFTKQHL